MLVLKTIDLCAGIGGIRRGFELAGGFRNISSAEIDDLACKTYEELFHENPKNDLTNDGFKIGLKEKRYDVLLAGFPCQAFSSVGLQQGFEDKIKGTIFFDIAQIIRMTQPKVIFLENVQNLLIHDRKNTIRTILDTLDTKLDYHVVGLEHDAEGKLVIRNAAFIRNTRDFGLPQNRPRVYIVAFSRKYFGRHLDKLPNLIPTTRKGPPIYRTLSEVLEKEVDARYFLSEGYLRTLENHIKNQSEKGYGFGYRIVNMPEVKEPIANTLLATGGSGRERNLIFDPINGEKYAGTEVKGKYSPVNSKCIRTMTPTEWGRLQGFIGYAFLDQNGNEQFRFPEDIPNVQRYKQLGNSVSIPVVEEIAKFIYENVCCMLRDFSDTELRKFSMYGNEFVICDRIEKQLKLRNETKNVYFNLVYHFSSKAFRTKDLAEYLDVTSGRASQILKQLIDIGCIEKAEGRGYRFCNLTDLQRNKGEEYGDGQLENAENL